MSKIKPGHHAYLSDHFN